MSIGSTIQSRKDAYFTDSRKKKIAAWMGLGLVILVGAFLRFYHLGSYSIGNSYYAATVKSMLTSWHNFFFVSFEPGGSVTVDKPPLGFWIQAASAYFFGVNGFALALPQALAGVLSIGVLYIIVKRHFGVFAGLSAAAVLAVMPVTVATERNNTIDGLLVFVLLLAAWAFLVAAETGRLSLVIIGAGLVGLGFNIKMLQAVMSLPAFYAVYFFSRQHTWWKRGLHLTLASVVLVVVSLSWALIVDSTPADERPYIGSSDNNTVMELIVGHNGLSRLGLNRKANDPPQPNNVGPDQGEVNPAGGQPPLGGNPPIPGRVDGQVGSPPPMGVFPPTGIENRSQEIPPADDGGPGRGRANEVGDPGVLRLFGEPLVIEASWVLPFAVLSILLGIYVMGRVWPLKNEHLQLIMWAGWLVPSWAYFSFTTGLFHRYYLIMIGPPLAALVGIGVWGLMRLCRSNWGVSWLVLLAISGINLAFESFIAKNYPTVFPYTLGLSISLWLAGIAIFLGGSRDWLPYLGAFLTLASLLVAPLTWSTMVALDPNPEVGLPTATLSVPSVADDRIDPPNQNKLDEAILELTLANMDAHDYLLATNSAMQAAPYILETGRAVLTFGGFNGGDPVIDEWELSELVGSGELRYVLGIPQGKPGVAAWVRANCSAVDIGSRGNLQGFQRRGPAEVLFDCAGS